MPLTAVDTFIAIANNTAAIYEKCPPFATYNVHTSMVFNQKATTFNHAITLRMADEVSVVHDERTGKDVIQRPFPVAPNFDSIADYEITGTFFDSGKPDFQIENLVPLTYRNIATRADAIARSVRGYTVTFADDSTPELGHLVLTASMDIRRTARHYLTSVYYSPDTLLPVRVLSDGRNRMHMEADYQIVDGNWLLRAIGYTQAWNEGSGHIISAIFATTFDNYSFSSVAPDGRLAPASLPPASASPSP
jgi:hypothetical protein